MKKSLKCASSHAVACNEQGFRILFNLVFLAFCSGTAIWTCRALTDHASDGGAHTMFIDVLIHSGTFGD